MTEENALLYPLAGLFSIVLSIPLLAFWKRRGWPRMTVILMLLSTILASWWYFDLSQAGADMQVMMFAMTLIPAVATAAVAAVIEVKLRLDQLNAHNHHHRRRRKSRSASSAAS